MKMPIFVSNPVYRTIVHSFASVSVFLFLFFIFSFFFQILIYNHCIIHLLDFLLLMLLMGFVLGRIIFSVQVVCLFVVFVFFLHSLLSIWNETLVLFFSSIYDWKSVCASALIINKYGREKEQKICMQKYAVITNTIVHASISIHKFIISTSVSDNGYAHVASHRTYILIKYFEQFSSVLWEFCLASPFQFTLIRYVEN